MGYRLRRPRPGWHIECSVMSQKYLKVDTLDIHAGEFVAILRKA